jgi:hypothetical protein
MSTIIGNNMHYYISLMQLIGHRSIIDTRLDEIFQIYRSYL